MKRLKNIRRNETDVETYSQRNGRVGRTYRRAGRIGWLGTLMVALILVIGVQAARGGEAVDVPKPAPQRQHIMPITPVDSPSATRGLILTAGSFSIFWFSVVYFVWRAGSNHKR